LWGPRCGNGVCDGSDTEWNCEADCGPPPEDDQEIIDETFNTDDGSTLCGILAGMGIGFQWECPGTDIWQYDTPTSQACSNKAIKLSQYDAAIGFMNYLYRVYVRQADYERANVFYEIVSALEDAKDVVQASPCYMFNT